jgi:AcrR family transcriptional regulator
MAKRKYELKKRAVKKRRTRERIVEATVALHQELGPKETTISAVAERAGVQRLTVYRHFPTERDLLAACSSSFIDRHPPPDPGEIKARGAEVRTRAVLHAFYRYYRETAEMWASIYRDKDRMASVAEVLEGFESHLETVETDLLEAWAPRRSRQLRASIAHALHFSTWQSLDSQGLDVRDMATLVSTWVAASAR